ncbi:protein apnoia [Achroia grisella]|uniref:protein apnoia n=1 Tax=Achroia grisella TaxID=688607 RepID=UPI0027D2113E|nr:protein apnoia [Achroia grisella]
MCNKMSVLTLMYLVTFLAVVQCDVDDNKSPSVVDFLSKDVNVGRTFGHNALKRLSFIFLPVMFTLGVISTLLMALAVISVKNLAIGVMLLIVAVSQAVSRLFFAASAPSPLVHLHPRAELLPAPVTGPWPASGPLLSPWARSDNEAPISD